MMTPDYAATAATPLETVESDAEARTHRTLLKSVRMTHAMSEDERELALVLMQAIMAWGGLGQTRRAEG